MPVSSTPRPSRGVAWAWNASARPVPSEAAQTVTAVPPSSSRPPARTPPAPQPTSTPGASASCTPSSVASGAARCPPEQKTSTRSAGRPPRPCRASVPASIAATRGSPAVERPQPMRTLIPATILPPDARPRAIRRSARGPARRRPGDLRPDGRGEDRRGARGRRSAARGGPAARRGVGGCAAGLPGPGDHHGRRRPPPSARGSSTGSSSIVPVDATFSVGQYAELAHAEIDALLAEGATPIVVGGTGLYLRAALAELDLRPLPPDDVRRRWEAELEVEGPAALHARLAQRAPWAAAEIDPADRHRIVRALCAARHRRARAAARGRAGCGPTTRVARPG